MDLIPKLEKSILFLQGFQQHL